MHIKKILQKTTILILNILLAPAAAYVSVLIATVSTRELYNWLYGSLSPLENIFIRLIFAPASFITIFLGTAYLLFITWRFIHEAMQQ